MSGSRNTINGSLFVEGSTVKGLFTILPLIRSIASAFMQ